MVILMGWDILLLKSRLGIRTLINNRNRKHTPMGCRPSKEHIVQLHQLPNRHDYNCHHVANENL